MQIPILADLKLVNSCIVHEDGTNILDINKLENVDTTGAVEGNVLSFDEATSTWVPTVVSGGGTEYTAGNGIDLTGGAISVTTACDTKWSTDTVVDISGKQDALISGSNIKTVNGNSLLGSGDIVIATGTTYTPGNAIRLTGDVIAVTTDCDTKWSTSTPSASAICVITEDSKTGYGTCYRAANPDNYGVIGKNAVDLSYSNSASTTRGATGYASTAMGCFSCATGFISTAMGYGTCAVGDYSTAMGYATCATGDYSTAMGCVTYATGNTSTAMGSFTRTYIAASVAIGCCTQIGSSSTKMFAVGYGTAAQDTCTDDYNVHFSVDCGGLTCTKQLKIVDGTQGAGKVLTSDADGLASWATPSSGGGTTASNINVASITNLTATDVQAALAELQASIDSINTQLAGIDTALQNINS